VISIVGIAIHLAAKLVFALKYSLTSTMGNRCLSTCLQDTFHSFHYQCHSLTLVFCYKSGQLTNGHEPG